MPTGLPTDEVQLKDALANAIKARIESLSQPTDYRLIPIPLALMPKVHTRQRFVETEKKDIIISTMPDPVTPDIDRTNIIEISIGIVSEEAYTGDGCTKLTVTYPITYECEVVDEWDNSNNNLIYTNSAQLVEAVYWRARREFKMNINLGYNNCSHTYLQQVSAVTETDEDTGGKLHILDWSLAIICTGVLV